MLLLLLLLLLFLLLLRSCFLSTSKVVLEALPALLPRLCLESLDLSQLLRGVSVPRGIVRVGVGIVAQSVDVPFPVASMPDALGPAEERLRRSVDTWFYSHARERACEKERVSV